MGRGQIKDFGFYSKINGKILKGSVVLKGYAINFPIVSSTSMKCKDFLICVFLRRICNCSCTDLSVHYMMNLLRKQCIGDILKQFNSFSFLFGIPKVFLSL